MLKINNKSGKAAFFKHLGHMLPMEEVQGEQIHEAETSGQVAPYRWVACIVHLQQISMPEKDRVMNHVTAYGQGVDRAKKAYTDLERLIAGAETEEAIARIEEFRRQYPDFAQAHNDLAVLYYRAGNKLQTLGHYEKAVRLEPTNSTFRKNLASFYFVEMGWTDDAIFIYTDLLKSDPNDTEVLAALGIISANLGRDCEARAFFTRILELEPWNHEARQALADLNPAPQAPPTYNPSSNTPSNSENKSADLDAILADLRQTIDRLEKQSSPSDPYANALALLEKGDKNGAVSELEKLVESQPGHALAHNDLGVLYQQRGDIPRSRINHERAVEADPTNPTFKKNLAGLYFSELDMTDDAIYLLTEVLRDNPNDVETLTGLARIAIAIGRTEEATTFLEKVTELEPWNDGAREFLDQLNATNNFFLASN